MEDLGMYYLRHRYYDPAIGRFINEDPIFDGFNWYVYANNNPIRFCDPTGLFAWPGQIHKAVQNHIMSGDPYSSIASLGLSFISSPSGRNLQTEIKIDFGYEGKSHFKAPNGLILKKSGRADIVDLDTGELWEIKSNQSGNGLKDARHDVTGYTLPGNTYNSTKIGKNHALNGTRPKLGGSGVFSGTFNYESGPLQYYTVNYWNSEAGIILYEYTLRPPTNEEIGQLLFSAGIGIVFGGVEAGVGALTF